MEPKIAEKAWNPELEKEILFCRDGIIKQEQIPLETIWDIKAYTRKLIN